MKKIFITGGHLTPALAVIAELTSRGWQIWYLGRRHALEGDPALSQEYLTLKNSPDTFLPITTGRLQRSLTHYTFLTLFKIPWGITQSIFYIIKYRPLVILSFGGYIGVPVLIAAWILRVPSVIHEQTLSPGLANRIFSRLAQKICISWPENIAMFPRAKVILTGNPLRKEIFKISEIPPIKLTKPVLYITGGNLGSHSLNLMIEKILTKLLKYFTIIHQCGNSETYRDYERLSKKKSLLPTELKQRYYPYKFIGLNYIGWVMRYAAMLVSRAGANIITEIIALRKPALLIPLPWAGEKEQVVNARFLERHSAVTILEQSSLTAENLYQEILNTYKQRNRLRKHLEKYRLYLRRDAALRIVNVIESLV